MSNARKKRRGKKQPNKKNVVNAKVQTNFPSDPESEKFKQLGNTAFQKGDFESALAQYDKAISINAKNPILFSNRAAVYQKTEQYAKALEDADVALELSQKKWSKAWRRKAEALEQLGRILEAEAAYHAGWEVEEGSHAFWRDAIERLSKDKGTPAPSAVKKTGIKGLDGLPDENDKDACANIAFLHCFGLHEFRINWSKGLPYLKKAAMLGDIQCCYNYALALSKPSAFEGAPEDMKDISKAFMFMRRAESLLLQNKGNIAKISDSTAGGRNMSGKIYRQLGSWYLGSVPDFYEFLDRAKARECLDKAIKLAKNAEERKLFIDTILEEYGLLSCISDYHADFEYFHKVAVKDGNIKAMNALASFLVDNGKKDEGLKYYKLALSKGDESAKVKIEHLETS